jgi:hypothetical protein
MRQLQLLDFVVAAYVLNAVIMYGLGVVVERVYRRMRGI